MVSSALCGFFELFGSINGIYRYLRHFCLNEGLVLRVFKPTERVQKPIVTVPLSLPAMGEGILFLLLLLIVVLDAFGLIFLMSKDRQTKFLSHLPSDVIISIGTTGWSVNIDTIAEKWLIVPTTS